MSPTIGMYNKNSILSRLGTSIGSFIGISIALLVLYTGYTGISNFRESVIYKNKVKIVQRATKDGNYELASRLLKNFEKEPSLKIEDDTRLRLDLETKKEVSQLESAIEENNYNNAADQFAVLKKSGRHTSNELSALEKKVDEISESRMFEKIVAAPADEKRIELAEQYLKIHSGGIHRKEAISYLLVSSFSNISTELLEAKLKVNTIEFTGYHRKITRINSILERYSAESISLSKIVQIDELAEKVIAAATKSPYEYTGQISTGCFVKVTPAANNLFESGYVRQRDNSFPKGSIGKVIDFREVVGDVPGGKYNKLVVQFSDMVWAKGTSQWSELKKYWAKAGERNTADYIEQELRPVELVSDVRRAQFTSDVSNMKLLFEKYYK